MDCPSGSTPFEEVKILGVGAGVLGSTRFGGMLCGTVLQVLGSLQCLRWQPSVSWQLPFASSQPGRRMCPLSRNFAEAACSCAARCLRYRLRVPSMPSMVHRIAQSELQFSLEVLPSEQLLGSPPWKPGAA